MAMRPSNLSCACTGSDNNKVEARISRTAAGPDRLPDRELRHLLFQMDKDAAAASGVNHPGLRQLAHRA